MKVLVVVLTADKIQYLKRIQACKDTWIPYKPDWAKVWILSGPKLGVPDSYDMMTFKIKALCRRALADKSWDWLLRVDDDVCVDWRAVRIPKTGDYVGPIVPAHDRCLYTQGAVTWLSRKAVQTLQDGLLTGKGLVEDKEVGWALNKVGIYPEPLEVHQIPRGHLLDAWDKEQLVKLGFVLELAKPEYMRELHASLNLPPIVSKVRDMTNQLPAVAQPGAVYRDHTGRTITRNAATFNGECAPPVPRGPAVSRPQEDKAWFIK